MRTRADIETRVAQIKGIATNSTRFGSPIHIATRDAVVVYVEGRLAADDGDYASLWAVCDAAMEAHYFARPWSAPAEEIATPDVAEPAPVVVVSPRTGKPKRKYTRRKKAK